MIFDLDTFLRCKPQVSLVNECGGLQSVIGTLLPEVVASQPPQVVVNQRENRLERLAMSVSPLEEQLVDWHGGSDHLFAS